MYCDPILYPIIVSSYCILCFFCYLISFLKQFLSIFNMSKIGGLKANRTCICGVLYTTFQEVAPLLAQRNKVSRANSEQLEELQHLVEDLLGLLEE